jgi:hypothetical protein
MPPVGFESTIPVFQQANTVHALDRAASVIGLTVSIVGINLFVFLTEAKSALYEAGNEFLRPVQVDVRLQMVNVQTCHSTAALCYAATNDGIKDAR